MNEIGTFDILGPNMIGPSSSHTAGALRIAFIAGKMVEKPAVVRFVLYGSFARTYHGHGTDRALVGGILGYHPDDERIRDSFEHAKEAGLDFTFEENFTDKEIYPNTVDIYVKDENGNEMSLRGKSIGGGNAVITRLNGVDVDLTGNYSTIVVQHIDKKGTLAFVTAVLSAYDLNIGSLRLYRESKGKMAYAIIEVDTMVSGRAELLEYCEKENKKISEAMFERETTFLEQDPEKTRAKMKKAWSIMQTSAKKPLKENIVSMGGMIGGESRKLHTLRENKKNLCGDVVSKAIAYAVGVLEVNASMGLIVAAPTAGSSGVIPGVCCSLQENYGFTDEEICQALFNAAAVGYLITRNATTAGAEGGCQAEVGAASAMAASAAVELFGGTPAQCLDAASFAIVNILGLVCDPIGGLVENPCQNRNAMGASNALISAELSMAGIKSITPIDETIGVMYAVGRSIPSELRETSMGGMAVAKSACEACAACAKETQK